MAEAAPAGAVAPMPQPSKPAALHHAPRPLVPQPLAQKRVVIFSAKETTVVLAPGAVAVAVASRAVAVASRAVTVAAPPPAAPGSLPAARARTHLAALARAVVAQAAASQAVEAREALGR